MRILTTMIHCENLEQNVGSMIYAFCIFYLYTQPAGCAAMSYYFFLKRVVRGMFMYYNGIYHGLFNFPSMIILDQS